MSICDLKFSPPVCKQRYQAMKDMVKKHQPKKVMDMGCGECSLLRQLKHLPGLHQLTGVDVERNPLEANRHVIKPLTYDYLHPRSHPFTISLYEGSIGMKDARMMGYDLVLCVEIIEHLYPDTLASLPDVVFGYMQPRIVVFTTPNADFNVLFPNFKGFRHWDHKFEWSREEFQSWGNQVANDYGYAVTYEGIGVGPPGTEHLGCCTQMAVFTCMTPPHEGSRHDDVNSATPYIKVCEVEYPHRAITMTTEEQILNEAIFYLGRLSRHSWQCDTDNEASDATETEGIEEEESKMRRTLSVTLEMLMKNSCLRRVCPSIEKLREVLASCDSVTLSEDGSSVIYCINEDELDGGNSSDEINACEEGDEVDDANLNENESYTSPWQQQEESWD